MGRLIWIDLEMTGLDVASDTILEIATIVTDLHLNILAEGPNLVIHQPQARLDEMDEWNQYHHRKSGLIDLVKSSNYTIAEAEALTMSFLETWLKPNESPICGNSVCQDRRFLSKYMPKLEQFFHYRALDITSLKLAMHYWHPEYPVYDKKTDSHRALEDVRASIQEAKHYKQYIQPV